MERIAISLFILFSFTGINLIQISKAMLTPFHVMALLLGGWIVLFGRKSHLGFLVSLNALFLYLLLNSALCYPNIRYTSLLYSTVFIFELIIFYNLIRHCQFKSIEEALKLIIYLYFVNLCLGMVLIILNIQWSALEQIIGIARTSAGNRPSGFSSEPSYVAFILSMTYLSYINIHRHQIDRSLIKVSGIYFLCIILTGSAYGIMLMGVCMLDWLRYFYFRLSENLRLLFLLSGVFTLSIGLGQLSSVENESIERISGIGMILGDPYSDTDKKLSKLKELDASAFARIGPSYVLFFSEESENFNLWLGEGAGAAGVYIPMLMAGSLIDEDDDEFDTGILPAFIFDYGLIGMGLLLFLVIVCFQGLSFPFWLIFIMLLPNANINTQIFWFGIASFLVTSIIKNTRKQYWRQQLALATAKKTSILHLPKK